MTFPKLVIFDCDGVLVDSEPIANKALTGALRAQGLALGLGETMAAFKGLSMASVLQKAEAMLGAPLPADFLDRLQAETFRAFKGRVRAVPGVLSLVERLDAGGVRTCVASSGGFDKMAVTLAETGLDALFDGRIFSATQVAHGKPAPDLFLYAAANMETAPRDCLVIEDSLPGVKAARAAGMRVLAYAPEGDAEGFADAGAAVIGDMREAAAYCGV